MLSLVDQPSTRGCQKLATFFLHRLKTENPVVLKYNNMYFMATNFANRPSTRTYEEEIPPELHRKKRLLEPIDRISEILFGLIMALSITCTISVTNATEARLRDLLFAALGCNIAWGLVDAVAYILTKLAVEGHNKSILQFIFKAKHPEKARAFIADSLPTSIASVLKSEDLKQLRKSLLELPSEDLKPRVTWDDLKISLAIFLLVVLSTIPISIPFLFIDNVGIAIRVSNLVAVILMFTCGWLLAGYSGYNKVKTGLFMTLLGVALVAITIALGG